MSPKTKEQFDEIRLARRTAIMETALELFAHTGFHNTSIAKIAKKAGVSKGLMYNYFNSKEHLLRCIIMDAFEEGEHLVDEQLASSEDPKEQLEHMIEASFKMVKENFTHFKLLAALSFQDEIMEMLKTDMDEKRDSNIAKFLPLFEKMGVENPMLEALFVGATLDGVMMYYMQMKDSFPVDDMKDYLIQKFCR